LKNLRRRVMLKIRSKKREGSSIGLSRTICWRSKDRKSKMRMKSIL
jgi:hypothetical protein